MSKTGRDTAGSEGCISNQEVENEANDGSLQEQNRQVDPVVEDQFQVAHGEQDELLPWIAAFGWRDLSRLSIEVDSSGGTLLERLKNIVLIVCRLLEACFCFCWSIGVLVRWL